MYEMGVNPVFWVDQSQVGNGTESLRITGRAIAIPQQSVY